MLKVNKKHALKVSNWWGDDYPLMACEEFGELMMAVSKVERSDSVVRKSRYTWNYTVGDDELRSNLVKELADVAIAVEVLAYRYSITDDELNAAIKEKLARRYD